MGLKSWWRRQRIRRRPVNDTLWEETVASSPLFRGLDVAERARLRDFATLFLQDKVFHGVEGPVPAATRTAVAAQAALLVLGLDYGLLRGWTTIIMYEAGFSARHEDVDEAGVVHMADTALSGEAWQGGPLVLSRADVHASAARLDGYNLVIHELAHKLDMRNGDANGYPPLPATLRPADWSAAFSAAYDDLGHREAAGQALALDDYALESPAEFFAVASEAFFELPATLRDAYPDVYRCLQAYYRQDPLTRLGAAAARA